MWPQVELGLAVRSGKRPKRADEARSNFRFACRFFIALNPQVTWIW